MQKQKVYKGRVIKEKLHKTNEEIKHSTVRIVGDSVESKVVTISEALQTAHELEVDLVEISPNATPPVCKLIDYGKFLYQLKKKDDSNTSHASVIKEIRLSYNIGEHDMAFKAKNAIGFLKDGNKVKVVLKFSGREIVFKSMGELTMLKFSQMVLEAGRAETLPVLEGKIMRMNIIPKKQ